MISGNTRLAAVIGHPARHSLSPAIHNAAYREAGLDWLYVAFDVAPADLETTLRSVHALGLGGLSVTMPHKDRVAELVDEPSASVLLLAACNSVVPLADGRLAGHNTDGDGLVDSLRHADIELVGRRLVVLGAGGAGRSIVEALGRSGAAEVVVVNRSQERAAVAAALAGQIGRVGTLADIATADIIVNATSIGMGDGGEIPFDPDLLRRHHVVVDAVYKPLVTPLLASAAARGCVVQNGLGMLVFQAARQFHLFTGVEAPLHAMLEAARTALE